MSNDGTNMKRLAELRNQRRTAGYTMSFHDEMAALAKTFIGFKRQQVDVLVKKTTQVLRANNIVVGNVSLDVTPRRGFIDLTLGVGLPHGGSPLDQRAFQDKIDTILDHGWLATWHGVEGQIEFQYPTR